MTRGTIGCVVTRVRLAALLNITVFLTGASSATAWLRAVQVVGGL